MPTLEYEIWKLPGDAIYEVVNGRLREVPRMGAFGSLVVSRLMIEILRTEDSNPAGEPVIECLFLLDAASNLQRRPDLAYVSYERLPDPIFPPGEDPPAWDVVPNLAVEVVSPCNAIPDLDDKIADYFRYGVELVWVVHPRSRQVHVYEAVDRVSIVTESGTLTGGTVLPGLAIPVASLFPPRRTQP